MFLKFCPSFIHIEAKPRAIKAKTDCLVVGFRDFSAMFTFCTPQVWTIIITKPFMIFCNISASWHHLKSKNQNMRWPWSLILHLTKNISIIIASLLLPVWKLWLKSHQWIISWVLKFGMIFMHWYNKGNLFLKLTIL